METSMTVIAEESPTTSHSIVASIVNKVILLCALVPYAVVSLGLRLVLARVFFLDGQPKIDGPQIPIDVNGISSFSIVLPAQIRDATFRMFETQYAALPIQPNVATYLFTYAEFVCPILLVLGFATRFSALALLAMTILIQVYVAPDALWNVHVYWISILMVLLSVGPGAISVDHVIRHIYGK
jgi:putative oxidoreductase